MVSILTNLSTVPKYVEFDIVKDYLKLKEYKKPVFGYFHMLIPHLPYRFDSECNKINTEVTISLLEEKKRYIGQLKCANKETLEFINLIKKNDPKSIIIISSDHGPKIGVNWGHLKKDNFGTAWMESYSNLIAFHIPSEKECKKHLYNDITLINVFRIVEGCIKNKKPVLLPNKWFYFDHEDKKFFQIK